MDAKQKRAMDKALQAGQSYVVGVSNGYDVSLVRIANPLPHYEIAVFDPPGRVDFCAAMDVSVWDDSKRFKAMQAVMDMAAGWR